MKRVEGVDVLMGEVAEGGACSWTFGVRPEVIPWVSRKYRFRWNLT